MTPAHDDPGGVSARFGSNAGTATLASYPAARKS